jgi:preprotein translocase subunit SecY
MASAAEQLAANINFAAFSKATDLQKRIWFTLFALIIFRVGTFIPIPGIDPAAFEQAFQSQQNGILGMFNMMSGGAVKRMAIFALNVMPYISASIIIQLMSTSIPSLERLKKEGEVGRKQLNQYTRYLTLVLAVAQSFGISEGLMHAQGIVANPGPFFIASTVITLSGGTMFLMWLGEQITARGIGNGVSLIIMAGIIADAPRIIFQTLSLARSGASNMSLFGLALITLVLLAAIVFIVFIERSQRRLVVQYPKRQQGNRMFMGESSFLPLKINSAGVIPPIFASSLLLLPQTLLTFTGMGANAPDWVNTLQGIIGYGKPGHMALYALGIIFFSFFYTSIVFNPEETADNLRKYGGFLPGIRPGKKTAEYLDFVLTRLTVIGAAYITAVPFYLGGTSIMIVISVTLDTVAQIQSHLVAHQYEGLIKRSKLRGSNVAPLVKR